MRRFFGLLVLTGLIFLIVTPNAYADTISWTRKADIPSATGGVPACLNGKVYVFGGWNSNIVYEFDPFPNTWTQKASMPSAKGGTVAIPYNGDVYIAGGNPTPNGSPNLDVYDTQTDTWTSKSSMPNYLWGGWGVAGGIVSNNLYVIGGYNWPNHNEDYTREYDISSDTWSLKTSMTTAVEWMNAAVYNNKIYIVGGQSGTGSWTLLDYIQVYDPINDTWQIISGLPDYLQGSGVIVYNDKLYIFGGMRASPPFPVAPDQKENNLSIYSYDVNNDIFANEGTMPVSDSGQVCLINNNVYLIGANGGLETWEGSFSSINPFINITYPNGGETLIKGQDYTITWDSGNITGDVQIDLYKGDTNVLQLAASASNTGSYIFNPPDSLDDGSDYRIGISAEGGTVSDFSDTYFTITSIQMDNGLITYWSFDNCDATDDSGNGNDGTLVYGTSGCVDGVSGNALHLNGPLYGQRIDIPPVNVGYNHTHNLWIKFNEAVDFESIFSYGKHWVTGETFYGAWVNSSGDVYIHHQTQDNTEQWFLARNINDSQYHMLTAVRSDNNLKFYVDGSLANDVSIPTEIIIDGKTGYVNHHEWWSGQTSSRINGFFDEFRIYNRALSVSEIQTLYGIGISGTVTSNGLGLVNVAMALNGDDSRTTSTSSSGQYSFPNISDGNYTITPSLSGYTFIPSSIDVTISGASITDQDFRACDTSVPLSGILRDATTNTPMSGVTVTVDDTYSVITDADGYYEISGLSCGAHTVTVDVPTGYSDYSRTMDTSLNATWDINLTKPETVKGGDTDSGYGPDPVNTATGNYIYQKKDLKIPGRGLSFIFKRDYNSQDATDSPLGFGWGHTYNVTLTVNTDSTITIRWGDGKTETWTPDGMGGFTPQYGVFDTLTDNGDGTYTLKKKDLTEYNFDTSGSLSSVVDKNGNTITLTYTGSNLTQITDTAGRNIDLIYDANNRITLITDPIGRTLQYSYDANGDLVTATDMNGNVTTYTYDIDHQLLTVVDPRGNTVVTNVYDALKRVVTSQSDAKGGVTTYTYDEVNKKTTLVDQLGYTTIHYHDELLRLIQETDDSGNSAYYEYDSTGNRIKVTDKNRNETNYTYDSNGNVLTKTDALSNVTTITYDSNNNPLTRTDALGNVTTFDYDANGNLTKTTDPSGYFITITYDPNGQPLTITDARSGVTTNTFDSEGNLLSVTDALGNTTTYTYDGAGRRLTVTDALGRTTTYNYDDNDNLLSVTDPSGNVKSYTYDANSNKLSITDPLGNTANFSYDVKDLLTTVTDTLGGIVSYSYDGLDRRISATDKNGNTTNYSYDWAGNIVSITDALSNVITYTYDANGNKLTGTNPSGQTVTYTYDALNRLVAVEDNLSNVTTSAYDALGKVISTTNAKGQTTDFDYDVLGRLTKVTDADGGIVTYTYDENGNRLTMTEPNGNTTSYTYDALNRLVQKVEPLGNTSQYVYDAVGNRISLTDAKGITITYNYDANNRLSVITYPDTSTITFSYDANGNRIQMVDSLGSSTYTYDALNRMVSHTDPFGKTIGYGYDANGNRTSLAYPASKVVNYVYDALNRLISVSDWLTNTTAYAYDAAGKLITTTNPNGTAANYSYDTAGRLTGLSNEYSDTSVISSYTFTLDEIGNHTSAVKDEPLLPILTNKNISYTYDTENRLINEGANTHFYDANGNLTAKGSDTYTYDYEDRLMQSNIEGVVSQYSYDGLGNRLSKTEGSATTRYVLDINRKLANVIAETDNAGTITAYYVYGLGLISKVLPDGTAYYYHYDSRGSTIALSDAAENLTDTYAYDTFGNLANSQGTTGNPFKYVGRYGVMDEGNGLNFIRARYYSPEIGRFIKKDLLTGDDRDGQSLNRYIYTLNNPVMFIDISGYSAKTIDNGSAQNLLLPSDDLHIDQIENEDNKNLNKKVEKKMFWESVKSVVKGGLEWAQSGTGNLVEGIGGAKDIHDVSKEVEKYDTEDELIAYIDNKYYSNDRAKSLINAQVDRGNWGQLTYDQKKDNLEIALQALGGRGKLSVRVIWDALFK